MTIPLKLDDSDSISDIEVGNAVITADSSDLAKQIAGELSPGHASMGKQDARYSLKKQTVLRRAPHLYLRVALCCPGEADKVFVYQVDWMKSPEEA